MSSSALPALTHRVVQQLNQLSLQILAESDGLTGYEPIFGQENVDYLRSGSHAMAGTLSELSHATGPEVFQQLKCREFRHTLRNRLAVVKGFADLMKMDLPANHSGYAVLSRISNHCREIQDLLDNAKLHAQEGAFEAKAA